jgi:hemoglobin-like flavoprotein
MAKSVCLFVSPSSSLFHDHPETRAVFTRVNGANPYSAEFKAHAERVLGGLDMTIGLLDDQEALTAQLAHLKDQHTTRNVKPEYYVVSSLTLMLKN